MAFGLLLQLESRVFLLQNEPKTIFFYLKKYNPRIETINEFKIQENENQCYFFTTDYTIHNLNIQLYGNYESANSKFYLVYETEKLRISNCQLLISIKNSKFQLAYQSHFLIGRLIHIQVSGVIDLNSSNYASFSNVQLVAQSIVSGSESIAIRDFSSVFLANGLVLDSAAGGQECPCLSCSLAAFGAFCNECKNDYERINNTCTCRYFNQHPSNFTDRCQGTDIELLELITKNTQQYFYDCGSHLSFSIDKSYTIDDATTISVFQNDDCEINNVRISGKLLIEGGYKSYKIAFLTPSYKYNISNITILLTYVASRYPPEEFSLVGGQASKNTVVEEILISGNYKEEASQFRQENSEFGLLFIVASSVQANITNIKILGFEYLDNEAKEGVALLLANVHYSAVSLNNIVILPMYYDIGAHNEEALHNYYPLTFPCHRNASEHNLQLSSRYAAFGEEFAQSGGTTINSYSPNCSFLISTSSFSDVSVNNTIVVGNLYSSSLYNHGVAVSYLHFSDINISNTYVNTIVNGAHQRTGVIAQAKEGYTNKMVISGFFSMKLQVQYSGIIGLMESGEFNVTAICNISLKSSYQGALLGSLDGGFLNIIYLTGNISAEYAFTNNYQLVGKINSGLVNNEIVANGYLNSNKNAYIGSKNDNGYCYSSAFYVNHVVEQSADEFYLLDCIADVTVVVEISHSYAENEQILKILKNTDCLAINFNISGAIEIINGSSSFLGLGESTHYNLSSISINLTYNQQKDSLERCYFFLQSISSSKEAIFSEITISGSIISGKQDYSAEHEVAGLVGNVFSSVKLQNITFPLFSISYGGGNCCAFLIGRTVAELPGTSLIISLEHIIIGGRGTAEALNQGISDFPNQRHASQELNDSINAKLLLPDAQPSLCAFYEPRNLFTNSGILVGELSGNSNMLVQSSAFKVISELDSLKEEQEQNNSLLVGRLMKNANISVISTYCFLETRSNGFSMLREVDTNKVDITVCVEGSFQGARNIATIANFLQGTLISELAINADFQRCYTCATLFVNYYLGDVQIATLGSALGLEENFKLIYLNVLDDLINGVSCYNQCCTEELECWLM